MATVTEGRDVARPDGAPPKQRRSREGAVSQAQRASIVTRAAIATALTVLAVLWLAPLAWALVTSLKREADTTTVPLEVVPEAGFTLEAYTRVLSNDNIITWFVNSTVVTVVVTVLTLALSTTAAYGFSRTKFRGRKVLFALTIAGIMVPPQILIVPLYEQVTAMGLADTYAGIILPQLVVPAMVFILKKFFDGIPSELEEAARVDGASALRIFWQVVMPLSRSIVAAVGIFVFIGAWNNFLWPFIIISDPDLMTLPVGLVQVRSSFGIQYAQVMASALLAGLPLIIIFMLFQRQIVRGVATTGLGGQ
ncbi:carbohydrate ABC transporter permease [Pseudokineococcus marinus]|uniref:Carbohydrate ABC transporter permease n=1 Tax=Pseudokineococcus marinus TaxID=351215 RepID=A0A849BN01_9ACTN|nr:carbohydrate ABC transporter permease [Pseudokineococcus marinus]NNH22172.1 carbohydrate ABC transporter permease [Pseudokineococcus marinus]